MSQKIKSRIPFNLKIPLRNFKTHHSVEKYLKCIYLNKGPESTIYKEFLKPLSRLQEKPTLHPHGKKT